MFQLDALWKDALMPLIDFVCPVNVITAGQHDGLTVL